MNVHFIPDGAHYRLLMDLNTVSIWTLEDRNLGNARTSISALDDAPSWLWMGLNLGPRWISIWALDGILFWLWMDRDLGSQPKPLMALNRSQSEHSIKVDPGWSQIWDLEGSNYGPCNAPYGPQRSLNLHPGGSQPGECRDINVCMR